MNTLLQTDSFSARKDVRCHNLLEIVFHTGYTIMMYDDYEAIRSNRKTMSMGFHGTKPVVRVSL